MKPQFPSDTTAVDETTSMIRFVRETLGCGCPDEVLTRIVYEVSDEGETGLDVGGRLLVRILRAENVDRLIESFPDAVERLRTERDLRGFRRVRLVVTQPQPKTLQGILEAMLDALVVADEHVFVHVVQPNALPAPLMG